MRRLAALLALLLAAAPAAAEVPLSGVFAATRDCPALLSIRRETNPGEARVEAGRRYPLLAANREPATHFRVRIEGAEADARRWVAAACGRIEAAQATPEAPAPAPAPAAPDPASRRNVLAASWLPAFCEGAGGRPECRRLDAGAEPAAEDGFVLHGLWPQPRGREYCGEAAAWRDRRWSELPFPGVDRATAEALTTAMPGVRSHLHRHQWAKHGACYGAAGGADEYFDDALAVLAALNASDVRDLFARHVGRRLEPEAIRATFDAAFGPGAGARVETICADGLILELRLHLSGPIDAAAPDLPALLAAAPPAPRGCGGRVDAP